MKKINQWIKIRDGAQWGGTDLYIAASIERDEHPELTEYLNAAAAGLGVATRLLDKAILLAAAESPTDKGELVDEKGAQ